MTSWVVFAEGGNSRSGAPTTFRGRWRGDGEGIPALGRAPGKALTMGVTTRGGGNVGSGRTRDVRGRVNGCGRVDKARSCTAKAANLRRGQPRTGRVDTRATAGIAPLRGGGSLSGLAAGLSRGHRGCSLKTESAAENDERHLSPGQRQVTNRRPAGSRSHPPERREGRGTSGEEGASEETDLSNKMGESTRTTD